MKLNKIKLLKSANKNFRCRCPLDGTVKKFLFALNCEQSSPK